MIFQTNQEIDIYLDWQNNQFLLGKGKLIEYIKSGYSFVLDEEELELKDIPDYLLNLYNFERWKIQWIDLTTIGASSNKINDFSTVNIRYLENIGLKTSEYKDLHDFNTKGYIEDKFIIINGVEVF